MSSNADAQEVTSKDWAARFRIPGLETWTGVGALLGAIAIATGLLLLATYWTSSTKLELLNPLWISAVILGGLIFCLSRAMRIEHISQSQPKNAIKLYHRELFVYLFLCLATLTAVALASANTFGETPFNNWLNGLSARLIFFCLIVTSFLPASFALVRQERRSLENMGRSKALLRNDVISNGSFWFGLILLGVISLLAYGAGKDVFNALGADFGVFATLIVVAGFSFFIVLSTITSGINNFFERRNHTKSVAAGGIVALNPGAWVSWLDSLLVRVVAPLSGATMGHDGNHGLGLHHLIIISIMGPLTVLGFALPQPWGLAPILLAFIIATGVGRRWAWVESDRETASRLQTTRGSEIHIGFKNDLRDEAMLAYGFLFILVPLTLYQINDLTKAFVFTGTGTSETFIDWVRFFGLELFKAVPLVDWAEIYGFEPNVTIEAADGNAGKHLIFASRVLVDFVVMAALFQALSIWQRTRTQRKLYAAGQLDVLDPISEEDFFERGMQKATKTQYDAYFRSDRNTPNPVISLGKDRYLTAKDKFLEDVEQHVNAKTGSGVHWPYSKTRLDELVLDERADVRAGARWMIAKYDLLAGDPRNQLGQLANRWLSLKLEASNDRNTILVEKQNFEQVLNDASKDPSSITNQELGRLASMMETVLGRPEFNYATIMAFDLIGKTTTELASAILAASVLKNDQIEEYTVFKELLERNGLSLSNMRQRHDEMRVYAYQAAGTILKNKYASLIAKDKSRELLNYMKPLEATKSKKAIESI